MSPSSPSAPAPPVNRAGRRRVRALVRPGPQLAALAVVFALGFASADPGAQAAPGAKPGAGAPAAPPSPAELLAAADEIAAQMEKIRGLTRKRPLQKGVLSREQIRDRLMARVRREYSPEDIRIEAAMLKRLGLLEPEVDYEKAVMELLLEQIAGFYDPFERTLYIADWLPEEMQRPALAHEIVHALQDQAFDLKPYAVPLKEDSDRQLARAALVEGDGTAAMLEYVPVTLGQPPLDISALPPGFHRVGAGLLGAGMMPAFDRAPGYLRAVLIFPYLEGLGFVHHVRQRKPWSGVDAIFARPPESTEQILHPDKYLANERPVAVREGQAQALGPGWKRLRRETLGEYQTRLWLERHLSAEQAGVASAGWGGDRLVVYEPEGGGPLALVQLSAWDSEADADEFAAALRRALARRLGQDEAPALVDAEGRAWSVERKGRAVVALLGVPSAARAPLAAEVWRTWKVVLPPARAPGR